MFVKKISKYIHVRSCFKGFIARNSMIKLKINLNIWFSSYDFFYFVKNHMHKLKAKLDVVGQLNMTTLADMHAISVYPYATSVICQRNLHALKTAKK